MEKAKKKQIKKYISWACISALVVYLAVMPLMASSDEEADGPQASILSGSVETGDITTGIRGGGTLAASEAVDVTIPSGVKITEFLVENGDIVSEGDALASVDHVSVMTAITQAQQTMEYLVEEMSDVTHEAVSDTVTAQAGGRVKLIYGQEGESVLDVMLGHGALAVLSLDGLMAVDIERNTNLATGDSVCVTLPDGTEVTGRVESNLNGTLVVTVEDEGYEVGASVQITTDNGDRIGSGALHVHNAWKATAYSGTISRVNVKAEDTVSSGKTLFTLTDTEYTAQLNKLAAQHREYEALMLELFKMYQSSTITAPSDGIVSGVDKDSIHLLSDDGTGWVLSLLANAPNGNDEATYANFAGMVTGIDSGKWNLALNPTNLSIPDYKDLTGVPLDTASMTQVASYVPTAPVYALVNDAWQQLDAASITVGDILLFAGDDNGNFVWTVWVSHADITPEESEPTLPSDPTEPSAPDETMPAEPDDQSKDNQEQTKPGTGGNQSQSGMQIPSGIISGGGFSGSMGGTAQQETEYKLFDLEGSTLMTITSAEEMTLTITVDEQDIAKIQVGQEAQVEIDALRNETFSAVVTEVGTSGTNNGGSSKFTAELTLARTENMLPGMNARVTIPLTATANVPVIPVEALVEDGAHTIVYTAYDESTGELSAPVAVTVGVSDGIRAEIRSGLSVGDPFYYAYYDTLELSTDVEVERFPFGR